MMKRLMSVTLVFVLALMFTGCGQKEGAQATGSQESAAPQNEKAAEGEKTETKKRDLRRKTASRWSKHRAVK
ncbi:hypothetical protein [Paenibacillus dendritiformis]|uniref:hypothetical protein n=1 Tax=Paenibacillus dendritiformis TaxID=130049 RepID=UPI001F54EED1|nr:hypothetical protein [Paenibacillus dendritiformis]